MHPRPNHLQRHFFGQLLRWVRPHQVPSRTRLLPQTNQKCMTLDDSATSTRNYIGFRITTTDGASGTVVDHWPQTNEVWVTFDTTMCSDTVANACAPLPCATTGPCTTGYTLDGTHFATSIRCRTCEGTATDETCVLPSFGSITRGCAEGYVAAHLLAVHRRAPARTAT